MDETPAERIIYLICQLAEFYQGGISYREMQEMPLPELYEIYKNAIKIQDENERAMKK